MAQLKTLVTGGWGFIGTHLCRALVEQGGSVRVLDVADPKFPVPEVQYLKGDVRNNRDLSNGVSGVQAVVHLASISGNEDAPLEGYEVNLVGTVRLLGAIARESELQKSKLRFVFASSAEVYGSASEAGEPCLEEEPALQQSSHYASQKFAAEQSVRLFYERSRQPSVVLRLFNVYGPGFDPSSPYSAQIAAFFSALAEKRALQLPGGGAQTQDYVSVRDVVAGLTNALELPEAQCTGEPINLGSGRSTSLRELAELVSVLHGGTTKLVGVPAQSTASAPMHLLADVQKASEILGWKPKVELAEGLAELFRPNR